MSTAGWRISERSLSGGTTDPVRDNLNRLLPPALVLAIAFAALLAGAVFALGAAESQRELGLFGVIGAPRRLAGAVLLWQGVYIGAVAAMVGAGGGVGLAALLSSPLAGWYAEIWGPIRPDYLWLALIGVAGFLGSVISCAVATKRVRRTPPLPALQQLPVAVTPSVTPRVAFTALVAAGAFIVSLVLLYVTGVEALVPLVGLLAVVGIGTVFLVSQPLLARMAAATPLTVRLACRSVMLAPGRAAAQACMVGAVVLLAGVVVTALGGLTQKMEDAHLPALPPGAGMLNASGAMPDDLMTRAKLTLQIDDPIRIDLADWPNGGMAILAPVSSRCIGDVGCRSDVSTMDAIQKVGATSIAGLEKILGRALTQAERRIWDKGGVIALTPELVADGHVVEFNYDGRQARKVPAVAIDVGVRYSGSELPNAYVKATTSKAAVFRTGRQYLWYFPPRSDGVGISEKQQDTVTDLVRSSVTDGGFLYVDRGVPATQAMGKIYVGVAGGAVLLVVGLSIVMIAISARDLAPEWRVLTDAGAAARTRRAASAAIGGVAAGIGTFGGLAATAMIYPALASALETPMIGRPWLVLLGTASVAVAVTTAFGWVLAPKAMPRR